MNPQSGQQGRDAGRIGRFATLGLTALGAFAVLLSTTGEPVRALTMFDREVTCPIGGQKFTTRAVAIYRQSGMRLDSRPIGSLLAPMPFPVCPDNGFVVYKNEFSKDEIAALEPIVLSDAYQQAKREHTDHYMAAFMLERIGHSDRHEIATLYLQGSWEAEDGKPSLVDQYRSLSAKSFDAFLKDQDVRSDRWWSATIIGADLQRMLGDFGAVERRLGNLPLLDLVSGAIENGPIMVRVIGQIRQHAKNRNQAPQTFIDDLSASVQVLLRDDRPVGQ